MEDYTTPPDIYKHLQSTITITQAIPADSDAILAFEKHHFPQWLIYYQRVLQQGGYSDVVIAKDSQQGIVGTSFVKDPHATWWQYEIRWQSLLGESTGGIGPLGVAESMREQGIGLALAARVSELVHERGFKKSYIDWTWLIDWYGKLGYTIWREYIMSWRKN